LEAAVRKAPTYADAWAMLALLHVQDYAQGFTVQADALTRGATAARQAVAAAPSNHLAHFSLAQALFFQKEFPSFRSAAARAFELNPMDGNSLALLAEFYTYSGDPERGLALADRAKQLNPNHPGWYWHVNFNHAYRQGDYRGALSLILKSNMTENWGRNALIAAAYGQLGEREEASKALRELRRLRPDVGKTIQREIEKWFDAEHGARLMEGLRKAGLEIGGTAGNSFAAKASDSGAVRAEEGFWVAVLPFKYSGGNADLTALADGLSEDVVTGLSRFSYLRVIARGSTLHYANQAIDLRTVGKGLGARYVIEGSLRQAGTKLRLAVQLVDTVSGAHLWAENYERTFSPEAVFELQDDLVPRIVSTVADMHGVLPRSMSEVVRSKASDQLSPYEAFLRSIDFNYRVTAEEHAAARTCMERAVQQAPGYADGWAMLSGLYAEEYGMEYNVLPDSVGRALQAAQRAVDAAPLNALAHNALARALFFRKEFQAFRTAAELAIELNPMSASTLCAMGTLIAYVGDWEHGCALVERAMQLLPRHPGWYLFPLFHKAYRNGDYRGAVSVGLKFNIPGFFATHLFMTAAYAQLGERDAAGKELRDLLRARPGIAVWVREGLRRYHDRELVEHYINGLRKAGLEITSEQSSASTKPAAQTE
jgi:TolB-like protein/Flp pilus assembly protein TadD